MPENIEKKCILLVAKAKSQYFDAQKIQIIYEFLLTSHYHDSQKILNKRCI